MNSPFVEHFRRFSSPKNGLGVPFLSLVVLFFVSELSFPRFSLTFGVGKLPFGKRKSPGADFKSPVGKRKFPLGVVSLQALLQVFGKADVKMFGDFTLQDVGVEEFHGWLPETARLRKASAGQPSLPGIV